MTDQPGVGGAEHDDDPGLPPEAARSAATYRAAYLAANPRRPPWRLRPALLLPLAVVLVLAAWWLDERDRADKDGWVRTTGRVVEVVRTDCRLLQRGCDPLTYRVTWLDRNGNQHRATFEVGAGDPEVGDPFPLRYRADAPGRAEEVGAGHYIVWQLRIAAALCVVGAGIGTLIVGRR